DDDQGRAERAQLGRQRIDRTWLSAAKTRRESDDQRPALHRVRLHLVIARIFPHKTLGSLRTDAEHCIASRERGSVVPHAALAWGWAHVRRKGQAWRSGRGPASNCCVEKSLIFRREAFVTSATMKCYAQRIRDRKKTHAWRKADGFAKCFGTVR